MASKSAPQNEPRGSGVAPGASEGDAPKSVSTGRLRSLLGLVALAMVAGMAASMARPPAPGGGRSVGLAAVLGERGLEVVPSAIVWLGAADAGVSSWLVRRAVAVVRATTGGEEVHDIYLVYVTLSPEGALLRAGRAYNLTETSAADELVPVGAGRVFAFAERLGDAAPQTVRLLELGSGAHAERSEWTWLERFQAALTGLQKTGQTVAAKRITYTVEPAPQRLEISLDGEGLVVATAGRKALISLDAPLKTPSWLSVDVLPERRPGRLVNWAVDRVRGEIGDEAMQYVKAIAFSALDLALSSKEAVTGDTGAEDIASDLGEEALAPPTREIPVDPAIGFPPPPLQPWVKPSLPGEGQWQLKDKDPFIATLPGLPSTFVTTFIRSDRRRKTTRVYLALWDPRLVQLNMMAGVAEPKSATGATGPGLIPREPAVLRRVAAAMNAGFQALHGEYGMMSEGVVYLPPKPYAATVMALRDGSTAFGSWPLDPRIPGDIRSYRQNMTVMVQDEKFNPYGRTWWGGTPADWEDKTHTVRTGICLTKEHFVGYFYGADLSPKALGQAMIQARCVFGVALDMNAGHSGLEFYRVAPTESFEPLDRPLRRRLERTGEVSGIEGYSFRARRFISGMGLMNFPRYIRREGRDYFYLTLRHVLPGPALAVPDPSKAKEGDGKWRLKGLPQHGFPYALASTEVALPSGLRIRVLKFDPRMLAAGQADSDTSPEGKSSLVLALNANPPGERSLWFSEAAFAIEREPPVEGALRLLSADTEGLSEAFGAVGVELEGGMLVYLEVIGETPVSATTLMAQFERLGVGQERLLLSARLVLALGGDTNTAGEALRLPESARRLRLWRRPGPGAKRLFQDTEIVPMKRWYPLQSRRVRYFKKRKQP